MKSTLTLLLLLLFINVELCLSQSIISTDNSSLVIHAIQTDYDAHELLNVTNNTSETQYLYWQIEIDSTQEEWGISVCDNSTCYPPGYEYAQFSLEPNTTGLIKLSLLPNGKPGEGALHLNIGVLNDSLFTPISVEYLLYVNGITSINNKFDFNPIIVLSNNEIQFQDKIHQVIIIDIKGSEYYSAKNVNLIDIDYLFPGYYLLYLKNNNGSIFSKPFIKIK